MHPPFLQAGISPVTLPENEEQYELLSAAPEGRLRRGQELADSNYNCNQGVGRASLVSGTGGRARLGCASVPAHLELAPKLA